MHLLACVSEESTIKLLKTSIKNPLDQFYQFYCKIFFRFFTFGSILHNFTIEIYFINYNFYQLLIIEFFLNISLQFIFIYY